MHQRIEQLCSSMFQEFGNVVLDEQLQLTLSGGGVVARFVPLVVNERPLMTHC